MDETRPRHDDDLSRLIPKPAPYSASYSYSTSSSAPAPKAYAAMDRKRAKFTAKLIASYVLDWLILLGMGALSAVFSRVSPNMRPFQLEDPDISYGSPIRSVLRGVNADPPAAGSPSPSTRRSAP